MGYNRCLKNAMWASIRPVLLPLDPVRIESHMTGQGIPDVNYTKGWIELKYAKNWPIRNGPLRIDHFTKEQKGWILSRTYAGGLVFVLLKVGRREWLLFDAISSCKFLGRVNKDKLYEVCLARWLRKPKDRGN